MIATEVKERPILFKGEMVRAILEGRKTQTRRIMKPQPSLISKLLRIQGACPCGEPGDQLWVRETFGISHRGDPTPAGKPYDPTILFRATDSEPEGYEAEVQAEKFRWRPSIHMPRWASRIQLEITDVRVERVQDISEEDSIAEGIEKMSETGRWYRGYEIHPIKGTPKVYGTARDAFRTLWNSINEKRGYSWEANPWVWVVEFRRMSDG